MSTATLPASNGSLKSAGVSPVVSDREWNAHILAQLANGKLTQEQALAQLKTAPKSNGTPLHCKVSEKGGGQCLRAECPLPRDALRRAMGAALGVRTRVGRLPQGQCCAAPPQVGVRVRRYPTGHPGGSALHPYHKEQDHVAKQCGRACSREQVVNDLIVAGNGQIGPALLVAYQAECRLRALGTGTVARKQRRLP